MARIKGSFKQIFDGERLHLVDHVRGTYPMEVLLDLPVMDENSKLVTVIGGRCHKKAGYRTDLASIPTRALKSMLEPKHRRPWDGRHVEGDWLVFVWKEDDDGTLVPDSYFKSAVAYAAVVHDNGYSLEIEPRYVVDVRFLDILSAGKVWSRYIMFSAVRLGGWPSYPHPAVEVTEDRILAVEAMDRWVAAQFSSQVD